MSDPTAVESVMSTHALELPARQSPARWAAVAFVASYSSPGTRQAYSTQLRLWFDWCERPGLEPLADVRRPHVEFYARELETRGLAPATVAWFLALTPDGYELTDLTPPDTPTAHDGDAPPSGGWPTVTGPPTVTVTATEPFPWAIGLAPGPGDRWCATTVRGSTSLGGPTGAHCDQLATPAQQGTPNRFGTGGTAIGPSGGLSWGLAPADVDGVEVIFTDGTRAPAELASQTTGDGRLWGSGYRDGEILAVVAYADGLPIAGHYPRPRPPGPGPATSPEEAFGDQLRAAGVDDFTDQQQAVFDLDPNDRLFQLPLDTGGGRAVGIRHRDGQAPLMFATACSLLNTVDPPDGWHALCLEQPQDGERARGFFLHSPAEQDSP